MKKILFAACILLICCLSHTKAQTQMSMATIDTTLAKPAQPALPVYGMLRYDSILQSMPEYAAMKIRVKQLRDKYDALDENCKSMDIDKNELLQKLNAPGFEYNPDTNKFW